MLLSCVTCGPVRRYRAPTYTRVAVAGATLYGIPGSHPCVTAELALARKGIEFRRIDLVPAASRPALRALRFPGKTVPALKLDGRRIQGSLEIMRELDWMQPEPPLYPADPALHRQVQDAERWGDAVFQNAARRMTLWAIARQPSSAISYLEGAHLVVPLPTPLAALTSPPIMRLDARLHRATDAAVRADLEALPDMLDRLDGWIADGVLGTDQPTAADFQILPSVRLLMTLDDLRDTIASRPVGEAALRVVPRLAGRVEAGVFPSQWMPAPLRA
jgi:glutathione S-transferase